MTNIILELFRTAPFKFINARIKSIIIRELYLLKTSINWNNESTAASLLDAEKEMLNSGKDIGWDRTLDLMPKDDNHHHWMSFASYLTAIYNRENEPKRFSIFRMVPQ